MDARHERRSYSLEFKLEAVRLTLESNRSKTEIARELGISHTILYKWCRAFEDEGQGAFRKKEGLTEEQ